MSANVVTIPCQADTQEDTAWEMNARIDSLLAMGIPPADIYIGGAPLDSGHLIAA